ncbi:sugar ABC transporter substrate-binding protein [Candidatus Halobonum tyrrellensis G22]|uniref:Sugar ABC transporter substrate-binding protein n=1 Tax=Candidatus Halobonum tyrrellensis G22 TaxID=1324957 RepID=V4HF31_9EURY|nr:sugar ABC transporter substrate-binding protein [Candidatus Halobonum tyrrellensis G22]
MAGATGAAGLVAGCSTRNPDEGSGSETSEGTSGGSEGTTTGESGGSAGGSIEIATADIQGHRDAFRQALRDGGLSEDVEISFLATSGISGDVQSQYRQWLQAGRGQPDIMRMDSGWTIPFIQRGQIANLTEALPDETVTSINENYFAATVDAVSDADGNLYGVPYQIGLPTVQYRKDLVEQAGFNPSEENWATEPMSWEKFSNVISQTHQQVDDVDYGYSWQASNYVGLSCCTFNELMSTWGGAYFGGRDTLFGPVGERPVTVDGEQVIQALRMARTFIRGQDDEYALDGYQSISPTDVLQWTEGPSQSQFLDGNSVSLRYWPSALPPAHEEFGDDLGVMPIPYGIPESEAEYEGLGGTISALGGWNMVLNPNTENRSAALQVLQAIDSEPFRQFQLEELDLLPPDTAALGEDRIGDIPVWGEYAETLQIAGENAMPRPVTVVWPDESPAIAERVSAVLAGQEAPDAAMSELKSTLETIESSV